VIRFSIAAFIIGVYIAYLIASEVTAWRHRKENHGRRP